MVEPLVGRIGWADQVWGSAQFGQFDQISKIYRGKNKGITGSSAPYWLQGNRYKDFILLSLSRKGELYTSLCSPNIFHSTWDNSFPLLNVFSFFSLWFRKHVQRQHRTITTVLDAPAQPPPSPDNGDINSDEGSVKPASLWSREIERETEREVMASWERKRGGVRKTEKERDAGGGVGQWGVATVSILKRGELPNCEGKGGIGGKLGRKIHKGG